MFSEGALGRLVLAHIPYKLVIIFCYFVLIWWESAKQKTKFNVWKIQVYLSYIHTRTQMHANAPITSVRHSSILQRWIPPAHDNLWLFSSRGCHAWRDAHKHRSSRGLALNIFLLLPKYPLLVVTLVLFITYLVVKYKYFSTIWWLPLHAVLKELEVNHKLWLFPGGGDNRADLRAANSKLARAAPQWAVPQDRPSRDEGILPSGQLDYMVQLMPWLFLTETLTW